VARAELKKAIEEMLYRTETDSPVYTFLPTLCEPTPTEVARTIDAAPVAPPPTDDQAVSLLMMMFRDAHAASDWGVAKTALEQLKTKMPGDPFVLQQLAMATYQGKEPDAKNALADASKILSELRPESTNDSNTLAIWGSIHKRKWELEGKPEDLDEAIRAYGKAFNLKDDYYNGINYAFMLNVRASVTKETDEAIADFVWAQRVRQRVIEIVKQQIVDRDHKAGPEEKFWLRATLIEALAGAGEVDRAEAEKAKAVAEAPEAWMAGALQAQLNKLSQLLANAPPV
jgi:tetratricopeptide (TPR) repeat protein